MDLQRLKYLDVGSLMLIKTVYEEKGVSKAGARLSLSQSALSKSLAKLRYLFEDDLFIRVGNDMQPTPKAIEVYEKTQDILRRMNDLFNSAGFDPVKDEYRFVVSCNDMVSESLFPIVLKKFGPSGSLIIREAADPPHAQAPADFVFEVTEGRTPRQEEERGRIVVGIGSLSHKIIVSDKHPLLQKPKIKFDDLQLWPKISTSFLPPLWSADEAFGDVLEAYNVKNPIILTPSMATALECVRKGDGVLIAPIFTRMIKNRVGLEVVRSTKLDHHISPAAFSVLYSTSLRNSRPHRWFVRTILESVQESLASEELEVCRNSDDIGY